jgi:hypothetical protein
MPAHSVVAIFAGACRASVALAKLRNHNFTGGMLSCLGKAGSAQDVIGCAAAGDQLECWGPHGQFWSALWRQSSGAALLVVPFIGPVLVAGAIVNSITELDGAVVQGEVGVIGAGLYSLGIPLDYASAYESVIAADRLLFIVSGQEREVFDAQRVIESVDPLGVYTHFDAAVGDLD